MFNILITMSIMFFTVTTPVSSVKSVTEQVYSGNQSAVNTTIPNNTPQPAAESEDADISFDYIKELRNLGYIKDEFGEEDLNIRNGVVRFQAEHNLMVDGDFGPRSTQSLKSRLKQPKFIYTDFVKEAPTKGKWILINKSRRSITLYEDKNVVKKYPIAVGNPPSLTPDGKYAIANKTVNPDWGGGGYAKPVKGGIPENPLGYRWMGLNIGDGNSYGVHGNNSPYSIGTEASHGCIRMINYDVEELFEILPVGTPVWISTDEGLSDLGIVQTEYGIKD